MYATLFVKDQDRRWTSTRCGFVTRARCHSVVDVSFQLFEPHVESESLLIDRNASAFPCHIGLVNFVKKVNDQATVGRRGGNGRRGPRHPFTSAGFRSSLYRFISDAGGRF